MFSNEKTTRRPSLFLSLPFGLPFGLLLGSLWLGVFAVPLAADLTSKPQPILLILEPVEGSRVVFQRLAPKEKGLDDQGRISIKMRLFNPGPDDLTVDRVEILGEVVSKFDEVPQDPIGPGESWTFQNCKCDASKPLIIDSPFPNSAKVEVFFDGEQNPLSKTVALAVHGNDEKPLSFVGRADDLNLDELWSGSSHHPSGHQVFGLDLGLRTWNGSAWSSIYPGSNKYEKESFPAYGLPVYAMADGVVCSALGDHTEPKLVGCSTCNTKSPTTGKYSSGGNHVFVQTGDEISLYAHFQPYSVPPEYLTPGAVVKRGAYLGKVGFSGATSGPHVHLHIKKEPDGGATPTTCDKGAFRPMMFDEISSLTRDEATAMAKNGTLTAAQWTSLSHHSFSHPTGLVQPDASGYDHCETCTDDLTYIGVWSEGTELDLRVKVEGWSAFAEKWQDLIDDRFHLIEVDVTKENGKEYYLGLYRRGARYQGLLSLTGWAAFEDAIEELAGKGLRLVDVDVFRKGNAHQWVGVFHQADAAHPTRDIVGFDPFAAEWKELAGEGLALLDLETYTLDGKRHFFGIFAPDEKPYQQKLFSWTGWKAFNEEVAPFADEGFHLVDIESYPVGQKRQYVGLFRPGVGIFDDIESWDLFQQTDEKKRNEGFEKDGTFYRLVDIHVLE